MSKNSTDNGELILEKERSQIALNAIWELNELIAAIKNIANKNLFSEEFSSDMFVLKGLSMRSNDLNSIVLSVLQDDQATNASLKQQLG